MDAPEGLLLGRSTADTTDSAVGAPTWILYESGDITLRRSRLAADVENAACFHLLALEAAMLTDLLPLRMRTILLDDGTVVLVDPASVYQLAGHDRRLLRRGVLVAPTTVCVVDPDSFEVEFPDQGVDPDVPAGRFPIRSVLLREPEAENLPGAAVLLGLAGCALRYPGIDLDRTLRHVDRFVRVGRATIETLGAEPIKARVQGLRGALDP